MIEQARGFREWLAVNHPECKAELNELPSGSFFLEIVIEPETWVVEYVPGLRSYGVSRASEPGTAEREGFEHPFKGFDEARAFVLTLLKRGEEEPSC